MTGVIIVLGAIQVITILVSFVLVGRAMKTINRLDETDKTNKMTIMGQKALIEEQRLLVDEMFESVSVARAAIKEFQQRLTGEDSSLQKDIVTRTIH